MNFYEFDQTETIAIVINKGFFSPPQWVKLSARKMELKGTVPALTWSKANGEKKFAHVSHNWNFLRSIALFYPSLKNYIFFFFSFFYWRDTISSPFFPLLTFVFLPSHTNPVPQSIRSSSLCRLCIVFFCSSCIQSILWASNFPNLLSSLCGIIELIPIVLTPLGTICFKQSTNSRDSHSIASRRPIHPS